MLGFRIWWHLARKVKGLLCSSMSMTPIMAPGVAYMRRHDSSIWQPFQRLALACHFLTETVYREEPWESTEASMPHIENFKYG